MRFSSVLAISASALIGVLGGCGGSTTAEEPCSDAGTCLTGGTGGGSGGVAGSGGVGGNGGVGGSSLCQQGCAKLADIDCPTPFDEGACISQCVQLYAKYPYCHTELDSANLCVLQNGVPACDDSGSPAFLDAEIVCGPAIEQFALCVSRSGVGGTSGVGGSSGFGGSSASGGSGGFVYCGEWKCAGWKLGALIDMQPCCAGAAGGGGAPVHCGGLVDSTIAALTSLPEGCHATSQPGNLECDCPAYEFDDPLTQQKAQYPGCCRSGGVCGVWVDLTPAEGPVLGCIPSWSSAAPLCTPGAPAPCPDAGT